MFEHTLSHSLLIEQLTLPFVGIFVILLRWCVRIRTVGLKEFQGDDYACILTIIWAVIYAVSVHESEVLGQNMDVTAETVSSLTPEDIKQLEYGSKMELLAWYSYSTLIWTLKVTILCFYKRLTIGSNQAKFVRNLFIFIGVAYVVVLLVTTFGCFPFYKNWQVSPLAPWTCRFRPQNLIVIAILNVTTSAGILCIPAPMLWKLKVPLRKKLIIALSLSSAVIVICSAITRAAITFAMAPSAANLNRWGIRECLLGTVAVNLPILRLLFTSAFWRFGPYNPDDAMPSYRKNNRIQSTERGVPMQAYEVGVRNSVDSKENIIRDRHFDKDVVVVQTTLQIEHHDRDEEAGSAEKGQHVWSSLANSSNLL